MHRKIILIIFTVIFSLSSAMIGTEILIRVLLEHHQTSGIETILNNRAFSNLAVLSLIIYITCTFTIFLIDFNTEVSLKGKQVVK